MSSNDAVERLVTDLGRPRSRVIHEVSSSDIDASGLAARLRTFGYAVVEWSAAGSVNPDFDLLRAMIRQLKMETVHAANWDAVEETLQWWADGTPPPTAIVVSNADAFRAANPIQWKQTLEVFADRGREWRRKGRVFRAVFVT